jgi:uncharacterized protein
MTSIVDEIKILVKDFYSSNPHIEDSHGIGHVLRVHQHSVNAIESHIPHLTKDQSVEIEIAALLHDVDDQKYFPGNEVEKWNAKLILQQAGILGETTQSILQMIDWVSTSHNGNTIPPCIENSGEYFRLIPRWSDRLEAIGIRGVIRCYQYSVESGQALSIPDASPRATSEEEVWNLAYPDRFVRYQMEPESLSQDMISHYYDKLLHVARPPPTIVRNAYLERKAAEGAAPLVEVCLRFGKTRKVDEEYFKELMMQEEQLE